jgi:hypothetical protein
MSAPATITNTEITDMFNHPGAHNVGPGMMAPMGGGTTAPMIHPQVTPQVRPMQPSRPLGAAPHPMTALMPQRQAISTALAKQHALASALRGGGTGVPPAAPHMLVAHAQGLPGIK